MIYLNASSCLNMSTRHTNLKNHIQTAIDALNNISKPNVAAAACQFQVPKQNFARDQKEKCQALAVKVLING